MKKLCLSSYDNKIISTAALVVYTHGNFAILHNMNPSEKGVFDIKGLE